MPIFYAAFGFTDIGSVREEQPHALQFEKARYLLEYHGMYETMFNQLGIELLLEIPSEELVKRGMSAHNFHEKVGKNTPWVEWDNVQESTPHPGPLVLETSTVGLLKTVALRIKQRIISAY